MEIPVLVEPVEGGGFRALSTFPFALQAEGTTSDEATQALRARIEGRMAAGGTIATLEVAGSTGGAPGEVHPILRHAGRFRSNPLFQEWLQEIEAFRKSVDESEAP